MSFEVLHFACAICGVENVYSQSSLPAPLDCRVCGARHVLTESGVTLQSRLDAAASRSAAKTAPALATAYVVGASPVGNFFKKGFYGLVGGIAAGLGAALAGFQFIPPAGIDPTFAYLGGVIATAIGTGVAGVVTRWAANLNRQP